MQADAGPLLLAVGLGAVRVGRAHTGVLVGVPTRQALSVLGGWTWTRVRSRAAAATEESSRTATGSRLQREHLSPRCREAGRRTRAGTQGIVPRPCAAFEASGRPFPRRVGGDV